MWLLVTGKIGEKFSLCKLRLVMIKSYWVNNE